MLYKVTLGRDAYLGTADEIVLWMSRAKGAPGDDPEAYMRGVAARLEEHGRKGEVDVSSPVAFLESLSLLGILRLEERAEASRERVDPRDALGSGPVAFGKDVDFDQLRADTDLFDDADRGQ